MRRLTSVAGKTCSFGFDNIHNLEVLQRAGEKVRTPLSPLLTPLASSQPHDLAVLLKFRDELVTCADDVVVSTK
ncbi:hypothetical protein KC365_g148 [Hortaea werneckii]|nr:hypothetical protein KC339_g147 [Hortaea werneckii]KAI7245886.1 hypothetical protein KC365_g148 [Hortaea werneckii]